MKNNYIKVSLLGFVFCLMAILSSSTEVNATHFRYGHLTWQKVSGTTARFTLTNAFRRDGYLGTAPDGYAAVNDIIDEHIGGTSLNFGDGTSTSVLHYKVVSIDIVNNWLLAVAIEDDLNPSKTTIDHVYPAATAPGGGPWIAEISACCRTSGEINNPDGQYRVLTPVELVSGNRSPVSSLPAIVNLAQGANSQFIVPAADIDANTVLTFRLASSAEAANAVFGTFNQPAGLTINPITGLVTWNTLGAVVGGYYSCQVVIEDRAGSSTGPIKTTVAVDFLIYILPQVTPCDVNLPPTFTGVTPANGSAFNVTEGQNINFTVTASDPDAGNVVTLNSAGIPGGATLTNALPAEGNPVSTTLNWNTSVGQAGAYVVTFSATDSCGLQELRSFTLNVAPVPVTCSLRVAISSVKTSCYGTCDGSLTANPSKGVAPYSYLWSNGETTKTITGLCKGPYTVTVTDAQGCTYVKACGVNSPPKINLSCGVVNVKCKGSCTGAINAVATGGSGTGYTYLWSNGETTASLTNLCKGTYTVTVTDSKGCTAVFTRNISEPSKVLSATISKSACSTCYPNCNGQATANPTGGVSPYTYLWSTGQISKQITGLCAGAYTVTVTDKNGCTYVAQTNIPSTCCNLSLVPTINSNTNCTPCNGSISVSVNGGSGSYSYNWSNGTTASSITGLCAGSYTVTVTDNNSSSCNTTVVYNVGDDIATVTAYCSVVSNESAPGAADGELDGTASGASGPYSYNWSNSATTEDIDGLTAGSYTLTVTAANGCTATTNCSIITEEQCDGDFTTYTQGGWGNNGAPGQYMAAHFETCFGSVVIGDPCGYTITLTDTNAVRDFLPQGSTAVALTQNYVDPGSGNITVLAGQVLGVAFALGFDDCDPSFGGSATDLGSQIYIKQNNPFTGWNIQAIYDTARKVLSGCPSLYTPTQMNDVCTDINENYDEGNDNGLFACPGVTSRLGLTANTTQNRVLTVYPNPFKDVITVKYDGGDAFSIIVTDLSGRTIDARTGLVNRVELGSDLQAGIYLVNVISEGGYKSVTRIVKN